MKKTEDLTAAEVWERLIDEKTNERFLSLKPEKVVGVFVASNYEGKPVIRLYRGKECVATYRKINFLIIFKAMRFEIDQLPETP